MARPRKNILLYCHNDVRMSITRFILHNVSWTSGIQYVGYLVHSAQTLEQVRLLVEGHVPGFFEGAVSIHAHSKDAGLSAAEYTTAQGIPTVFTTEDFGSKDAWKHSSAAVSLPPNQPPCEWIGRLKILSARKRGPKKNSGSILLPAAYVQSEVHAS